MRYSILIFFVFASSLAWAQGIVETEKIYSEFLANSAGEDPNRDLTIYLPPGYSETEERYPVIYYLPGIGMPNQWLMKQLKPLLDKAIKNEEIKPLILVIIDHFTIYQGSYFSRSAFMGDWISFTNKDVVHYLDKNYRTIPNRKSRALAGWSSGGFGALKIGMQSSEIFANVYSLSPGLLVLSDEFAPDSPSYSDLEKIEDPGRLQNEWIGIPNVLVAAGRAFAPNPDNPPYFADLPVVFESGNKKLVDAILKKWNEELPINMIQDHADQLRTLNSLKLEWGRNDGFKNVVTSCRMFSKQLENFGIEHVAEEYNGTHFDRIFLEDGRIAKDMLPFLNDHLEFEDSNND